MVETQRVPTNITTWQQQPLSGFQKLDQGYIAPQQQQWGYSNQTQQQMTPLQETLIARATIIDETTPSIRRYVYEKDIVTIPRITEIHEQPIREIHEQPVYRTVYKPNPVLINVQDQKTVETVMSEKPIVSTQTYQEGSWSSTKASDDSYLLNLDLMNREPYINQDYYNYLGGVLGTSQEGLGFHRALAPPSESFIFQKSTQQPFVRGGEGFIQRGGAVPPPPGPMPQNYRPKSHRVPIPPGPMPSDYQPRISTYSERIFTGYQRPSLSQRLKELKKRDTFAQKPFFETRERGFIQQGVPPPPGPMPLDYHSKIPTESGILHSDKLLPDQLCYTSEKAPTATLYAQKTSDEQEKKVFSHLKLKSDELCYSSSERERTEKKREFENLPIIRPEQHIIDVVDVPEAPKEMPTDYTTRMPSVLEQKSKTQTVLAQPTPSIAPAVLLTKKQKKAKKKAEKKQKKKAISSKNVPAFPGPMPSNFKYRIPTDI